MKASIQRGAIFCILAAIIGAGGVMAQERGPAGTSICDTTSRDTPVCRGMRALRSQIQAITSQRELMQINYPWMQAFASAMSMNLDRLLGLDRAHLEPLRELQSLSVELERLSREGKPEAYSLANSLQRQCQRCHSRPGASQSGYDWAQIFSGDWIEISERCNRPGVDRIPYRCKSMYGMLRMIDSMYTALLTREELHLPSIRQAAREVQRIAEDLEAKDMLHSAKPETLRNLAQAAGEIVSLTELENRAEVSDRIRRLSGRCLECHGIR